MSVSKATLLYMRSLASLFDEQCASEAALADKHKANSPSRRYHEGKSKAYEEAALRITSDLEFLDAWTAEQLIR